MPGVVLRALYSMPKRPKEPTLDEVHARLRAKGATDEQIEQFDRAADSFVHVIIDEVRNRGRRAREADERALWDTTAEPSAPALLAWELQKGPARATITVSHHPEGRLVTCADESQVIEIVVKDVASMLATVRGQCGRLLSEGWKLETAIPLTT